MGLMPQIYILLLHIPARIKKQTRARTVFLQQAWNTECEKHLKKKRREKKKQPGLASAMYSTLCTGGWSGGQPTVCY